MIVIFLFAWHLGIRERRRLAVAGSPWSEGGSKGADGGTGRGAKHDGGTPVGVPAGAGGIPAAAGTGSVAVLTAVEKPRSAAQARFDAQVLAIAESDADPVNTGLADSQLDPNRSTLRPKLFWFNLALTVAVMVGSAVALVVNFPKVKDQARALVSHAGSIVAVVSMVMAAAVLTGVLSGTGMVDAMARASIAGQPVHMQSPLAPAILLLVSLSRVELGDHHKKTLWRALVVALVMLGIGIGIGVGAIPWG